MINPNKTIWLINESGIIVITFPLIFLLWKARVPKTPTDQYAKNAIVIDMSISFKRFSFECSFSSSNTRKITVWHEYETQLYNTTK